MEFKISIPYNRIKVAREIGYSLFLLGEIKKNTDENVLEWLLVNSIPNKEGRRQIKAAAARVMTREDGSKSEELSIVNASKRGFKSSALKAVAQSDGFIPPKRGVKGKFHQT